MVMRKGLRHYIGRQIPFRDRFAIYEGGTIMVHPSNYTFYYYRTFDGEEISIHRKGDDRVIIKEGVLVRAAI